jgi:hypothetical protein
LRRSTTFWRLRIALLKQLASEHDEHTIDHVTRRARVARSSGAENELEHLRQRRDQLGLRRDGRAYRTAFGGRSREGLDARLDLHPRRTRIFDKAPLREPSLVLNHKRAFEIDALASA